MKKISLNNTYDYKSIEVFTNTNNSSIQEHGNNCVGENFLIVKHNSKDITTSFVLVGYNNLNGNIYKCIYNDMEN